MPSRLKHHPLRHTFTHGGRSGAQIRHGLPRNWRKGTAGRAAFEDSYDVGDWEKDGKGTYWLHTSSHPPFGFCLFVFFVAGPDFTQASRLLRTAPDLLLGGFRLSARLRSCPLSCPGGWDVFGKHQLG